MNQYEMEDLCKGAFKGIFTKKHKTTSWTSEILGKLQKENDYELMEDIHTSQIKMGSLIEKVLDKIVRGHYPDSHAPRYTHGVGCDEDEAAELMEDIDKMKKRGKSNRVPILSNLDPEKIKQHIGSIKSLKKNHGRISKETLQNIFDRVHDNLSKFQCDIVSEFNCDLLITQPGNEIIGEVKLSADKDKTIQQQMWDNMILPYLALGIRDADVMLIILSSNKKQKDHEVIDFHVSGGGNGIKKLYTPPSGIKALADDLIMVEEDAFKRLFGDPALFKVFQNIIETELRREADRSMDGSRECLQI